LDPLLMEITVDARRAYKKNPQAFEQAIQNLKRVGLPVISEAADAVLKLAKGEARPLYLCYQGIVMII